MSNYPNRETLFNVYMNTNEKEWEYVMGTYVTEGVDHPQSLYYLSLDSSLESNFVISESFDDRIAKLGDFYTQEVMTIALPQRLLANTDLQGCWNQIFSKLSQSFRTETDFNMPITLYLYEIDLTDCVVIDNRTLVDEYIVHNAYTSNTHAVFGLPKLKLVQQLLVENTFNYPDETCTYYHPFNDNRYAPVLLSTPLVIKSKQAIS